ncbi:DoxX family protein [Streptomyces glaucescens]|uniref:Integral membrane protein n=1 Tax=Streptomyces glaucescens TaxID=1907 RepID=A0A089XB17_STRGA|nr:DoxX family protein [Streptomyces glaucescens]AIR99111.1 integral membrane protein [Streptomyces glaucescens]
MSVDTRTPRTPTGDRSSGFDDAPALSMVKVPSDPAQVIVNHASFRVQLGASSRPAQSPRIARHLSAAEATARHPVVTAAAGRAAPAGARRRPVVWSGRSAPDDTGAHRLLQAVRGAGAQQAGEPTAGDPGATRVIPRVGPGAGGHTGSGDHAEGHDGHLDQTVETPVIGAQRTPRDGTRLLPRMRTLEGAYDHPAHDDERYDDGPEPEGTADPGTRSRRQADDPARHAYYPGRRMHLGVVLLPLRVFLGFISIYAGMGKLCDPVYFDGGRRGSMVTWLNTLHPWEVAEPLRQFALEHPVGSGLVIAFAQVLVGVLTVFGCWQRVAAVGGALLSAALLVTVSWKSVPAYDAPDIIYLAAWSPLVIAGAPVYSVDGRLAGLAWRRLGPRADIWDLRWYVLRRGALVTAVVVGLTLLVGSLLGGAVRDADRVVVPGPGEPPRNELPGSPLPQEPGERRADTSPSATASPPTQDATSAAPTAGAATTPGATQGATTGAPSQTQGTTGQAPPQQSVPEQQAPSATAGPTSGGGTATGGGTGAPGTSGDGGGSGGGSGDTSSGGQPGLVGGLLG